MKRPEQSLSAWLFRRALLAFPRAFRDACGQDMERAFVDGCRAALGERGWAGMLNVATRGLVDACVQGLAERASRWGRSPTALGGTNTVTMRWTMQRGEWLHAIRSLRRAPTFALVCVLTFALVVGAAAGIFGAVDAVLLRALPYPDPNTMLFVGELAVDQEGPAQVSSYVVLDRVRETTATLEDLAIFNIWEATLTEAGEPTRLSGAVVEWNYFDVLRRAPAVGRTFTQGEGGRGSPRIVVISDRLWRERFGGDRSVIGRPIVLSGAAHEIVGVMPRDFVAPDSYFFGAGADIWRPVDFTLYGASDSPGFRWLRAVARARPGAEPARIRADLDLVRQRLGTEFPEWAESSRVMAVSLKDQVTGPARPVLAMLAAMALLVLLVGCANLANLALARGIGRQREIEIREALGAGRGGAVRPLILEMLLLAVAGAGAGLVLAGIGLEILVAAAPGDLPGLSSIALDARAIAAAFSFALLVGAMASAVPALRLAPAADGAGALAGGTRGGSAGRHHHRAQSAFAIVQLGLALAVLTGAALLARSFASLTAVDPGYRADGLLAAQLDLPATRYADAAARRQFTDGVLATLLAHPSVASASFVTSLPQHGLNNFNLRTDMPGRDAVAQPWAHYRGIAGPHLETLGITLRRGRALAAADLVDGRAAAALVNEEFVRRFFPDQEVLGERIVVQNDTPSIVGIVGSVKYDWLGDEAQPEVYVPYAGDGTVFLVARANADLASASAALREVVRATDPLLPTNTLLASEQLLAASVAEPRFALLLLTALAAIAVTLAALGLYGVISYAVSERSREIGIRVALGARHNAVVGLVMRRGMFIAGAGVLLGLFLAINGASLVEGLLFGVTARDPLTFFLASLLLVGVALLACWRPARRAARIDPGIALRAE
jgi:putative ABC transport system permease protein